MRGVVGGKLLRGGIKDRRILSEGRPRTYSSKVGDEEFDQISDIQVSGSLLIDLARFLLK